MKKINLKTIAFINVWLFFIIAITSTGIGVLISLFASLFYFIVFMKEFKNEKKINE